VRENVFKSVFLLKDGRKTIQYEAHAASGVEVLFYYQQAED
jgi:hypothetical protein